MTDQTGHTEAPDNTRARSLCAYEEHCSLTDGASEQ